MKFKKKSILKRDSKQQIVIKRMRIKLAKKNKNDRTPFLTYQHES
jgi:hypothetical protein